MPITLNRGGKSCVVSAKKVAIGERVKAVFYRHRRRYGVRRIAAELKAEGVNVGRWLVRSQMTRLGLRAIRPRPFVPQTTGSRQAVEPSPNLLLDEKNVAQKPRDVIVDDITYLPLRSGKWGYLASWQDKFSRRIVGWAVAERMTEELVSSALSKAVRSGCVTGGTIIHTDQGSQYVSNNFRALLSSSRVSTKHELTGQLLRQRTGRELLLALQGRVVRRRGVRGCESGAGRSL